MRGTRRDFKADKLKYQGISCACAKILSRLLCAWRCRWYWLNVNWGKSAELVQSHDLYQITWKSILSIFSLKVLSKQQINVCRVNNAALFIKSFIYFIVEIYEIDFKCGSCESKVNIWAFNTWVLLSALVNSILNFVC